MSPSATEQSPEAALLNLAPTDLPLLRPARFDGGGFEVPTDRLSPDDQDLVRRVYDAVQELSLLRQVMKDAPDYPALEDYIRRFADGVLLADVQRLGQDAADTAVRRATHDIRGGGLTVLLGTADLLASLPGDRDLIRSCVAAARDHAKIMRNLVPDLDPAARAADEAAKAHGIDHFTTKWAGATVHGPAGPVTVSLHCSFTGAISARCLETASIDRVVYNYVNNAVRFAAGVAVALHVLPVGRGLTRWVVRNAVAPDQAAFLAGHDPARLFAGGVTRGGTGVGLSNCAVIVADCFGLDAPDEAVARRYLGSAVRGDEYLAWFHWPAYESGRR